MCLVVLWDKMSSFWFSDVKRKPHVPSSVVSLSLTQCADVCTWMMVCCECVSDLTRHPMRLGELSDLADVRPLSPCTAHFKYQEML